MLYKPSPLEARKFFHSKWQRPRKEVMHRPLNDTVLFQRRVQFIFQPILSQGFFRHGLTGINRMMQDTATVIK